MTDRELVAMFKSDMQRAMESMIKQYGGLVYTIVRSKLGGVCSAEDTEETVSDIFVLIYKNADKIDLEKGSVKSYISVIAKRAAIRKAEQLSRGIESCSLEDFEKLLESGGQDFAQREQRQRLTEYIKQLGKPDSDIILLKYFYGFKSKEIGRKLGLKTNTVDKKISRSLAKLKSMIEEEL
jgi:RNA polymerase sigma-70 factor (ECF subfamily)